MDENKIIDFLKSDKVSREIWEEVAGLIIEAIENGEENIEELTAALND